MNKFFTKIAGLTLGLAMAIGVGVALGSKSSDVKSAEAAAATYSEKALANLAAGDQVLITTTSTAANPINYYIPVSTSYTGTAIANSFRYTSVNNIDDSNLWTVEKNNSNYAFKFTSSNNTYYLTVSGAGTGNKPRISTTTTYKNWTLASTNYGTSFQNASTSNYLGVYVSGSDWRVYGSSGHDNFVGTGLRFHFYVKSSKTPVQKTITGPSNMSKTIGDASVDIASNIKVDGNVLPGCTVVSNKTNVVSVSGTTLSFVGGGSATITISHSSTETETTIISYTNATFTVTVSKSSLPSMVSGDYGKITSSSDLTDGYYLLVCEANNKAFNGSLSTLSSNPGAAVSISNSSIGSTSTIDTYALYIASNGESNGYSVAAKVKYADNGYKYIGRANDSNGVDESDTPLANTIAFDASGHALITGAGGRRIWANTSSSYVMQYYSSTNTANLFLYKKGSSSATFTVTYDANGATSGDVPTDETAYATNASVTVKGNTGSLAKTGFTFNGWNLADDGSGTHYAAGTGSFSITANTTLYAEWVKTLDAITSIGGTAKASLSDAGTTNWDYSNVTVTGTLSGVTGQDVKTYVNLSSSTDIPDSIGSCTLTVTATKKDAIPGDATSLTNNNVSGEIEAAKLVYTFTMSQADLKQNSYANEDAAIKEATATCTNHDPITIYWRTSNVMHNNNSGTHSMQFKGGSGYLYNTTEIPGTLTSISYNNTLIDGSLTNYYGNTEAPSSSTTPGGKYFKIACGSSNTHVQTITITFEVSDKPKVQLVAENMTLDVADGAATPTITDGTSAVTGYALVSADSYVATITNDGKVQPTGYGTVSISVTKEEDSGHIYLATSFSVSVGDHSKEASIMAFTAKASDDVANRTADDGVVWSIDSGSVSENDFSEVYGINFGTNGSKISSLTLEAPADDERIIKNVVVEAMSALDGSTITVSVGDSAFVCSKSNSLSGSVTTYNFSGNTSGAITITMSGTASTKYGVKSIAVLYVGDEATSFASTFLGAIACNNSGTSKPSFNIKEGQTRWTWALLETEFGKLSASDKAKFAKNATGVSQTIIECVARYDYIVGKYFVAEVDKTLISSDFMSRSPAPVGNSRIVINAMMNSTGSSTIVIVIISAISLAAIGGYFLFRKKKEN